jgi:hypothetical protein
VQWRSTFDDTGGCEMVTSGRGIRIVFRATPALAWTLTLSSCFIGYDSRWGQAKAAQQRLAAQSTPGAIQAAPDDSHSTHAARTYRIRFRPNAHYLAQTVDAERQLSELVESADRVLAAAIGLHLQVDKTQPWSFDADERLEPAIAALARDDAARDVDVVVGLIGALPRPTESLHEVGYAEILGKHIVLRAASRLGEHDAFDRALTDLSDDERDRVIVGRRRHRAEAVLLHEIGHVLGALHETDPTSLMHPAYDPKMASYGEDAVVLMRLALTEGDRDAVVRAQRDYVRNAKTTSWAPGAREEALAWLEAQTGAAAARTAADAEAPSGELGVGVPAELRGDDRPRFTRAVQMLRGGAVAAAYDTAKPLFAAYPSSRAVQDLRCQLATVRYLDKSSLAAECAGSVALLDAGAGATR